MLKLASIYKVDIHWLLTGEGEMFREALNTEMQKQIAEKDAEIAELKKIAAEIENHEVKLQNLEANNQILEAKCNELRDELLEKYRALDDYSRKLLAVSGESGSV
jgi:cell division protein FtsB